MVNLHKVLYANICGGDTVVHFNLDPKIQRFGHSMYALIG